MILLPFGRVCASQGHVRLCRLLSIHSLWVQHYRCTAFSIDVSTHTLQVTDYIQAITTGMSSQCCLERNVKSDQAVIESDFVRRKCKQRTILYGTYWVYTPYYMAMLLCRYIYIYIYLEGSLPVHLLLLNCSLDHNGHCA